MLKVFPAMGVLRIVPPEKFASPGRRTCSDIVGAGAAASQAKVQAIDLSIRHRLSYWDALILVTASVGGCDAIYTEDLGHRDTIAGVRIVNPFRGS